MQLRRQPVHQVGRRRPLRKHSVHMKHLDGTYTGSCPLLPSSILFREESEMRILIHILVESCGISMLLNPLTLGSMRRVQEVGTGGLGRGCRGWVGQARPGLTEWDRGRWRCHPKQYPSLQLAAKQSGQCFQICLCAFGMLHASWGIPADKGHRTEELSGKTAKQIHTGVFSAYLGFCFWTQCSVEENHSLIWRSGGEEIGNNHYIWG